MNKAFIKNALITATLIAAPSFADEGFGIFGSIGKADHDLVIFSDSDTSFSLGGEYRFNENFTTELRYDDYGSVSFNAEDDFGNEVDVSATSFGLGVKGIIPLNEQFNVYAKIGFARWDIDDNEDSETGTDFYYGFGAQYMATEQVGISLEYTMLSAGLDGFDGDTIDYDLTNIAASVNYYF